MRLPPVWFMWLAGMAIVGYADHLGYSMGLSVCAFVAWIALVWMWTPRAKKTA